MSKQRKKGTSFETELLDTLRQVWPAADRSPLRGINDRGDFTGVNGWIIEAKKRERWDIPAWVRGVLAKRKRWDATAPWMIVFANDRRGGLPTLVVLEWEQYVSQLRRLEKEAGHEDADIRA